VVRSFDAHMRMLGFDERAHDPGAGGVVQDVGVGHDGGCDGGEEVRSDVVGCFAGHAVVGVGVRVMVGAGSVV